MKTSKRPTTRETRPLPQESMREVVDGRLASRPPRPRASRVVMEPLADRPIPETLPRFKAGARLLPLISLAREPKSTQVSVPYGGQPSAVALAHRVAARAIDLLEDMIRRGVVDLPVVSVTKWSASVRVEHDGEGDAVAAMLASACASEARVGGKPTHRIGRP